MSDVSLTEVEMFKAHDFDRLECADHDGNCCPAGCHNLTVNQYQHYEALVAARVAEAGAKAWGEGWKRRGEVGIESTGIYENPYRAAGYQRQEGPT